MLLDLLQDPDLLEEERVLLLFNLDHIWNASDCECLYKLQSYRVHWKCFGGVLLKDYFCKMLHDIYVRENRVFRSNKSLLFGQVKTWGQIKDTLFDNLHFLGPFLVLVQAASMIFHVTDQQIFVLVVLVSTVKEA